MRGISSRERLKKCGTVAHGPVTLILKNQRIIQHGLTTCGSVWACPVCSAKILAHRSQEVQEAMQSWVKQDGYFIFETLTLCHRPGDTVAKQRFGLSKAWEAINGGSFAANHKKAGQEGYLKIVEATYGLGGFHLHIHALRFMKGSLSDADEKKWMHKVFSKWNTVLIAEGFKPPSADAHSVKRVTSFDGIKGYFTKGFDNPALNEPDSKATSIWNLLTLAIANPKSSYTFAWRMWESQSLGMRQMTWARGLRNTLGMSPELFDEELLEQSTPLIQIEHEDIRLYGHSGSLQPQIRTQLLNGSVSVASSMLTSRGIRHRILSKIGEQCPDELPKT